MKKARTITVIILAAVAFACLGAYTMLGIFIDPPIKNKSAGETVVYFRRLVKTPFIFSSDSVALLNGATPTEETRVAVSKNVNEKLSRFRLFSLPFNKALYLKTTDNRDFILIQPAEKKESDAE